MSRIEKIVAAGLIALLAILAFTWASAEAVGPVVGRSCEATWIAPTTHVDGTPLTGALTFNLYLAPGNVTTAPATPALTNLTGTVAHPCQNITPGQYTLWVTAVETLTGSASESAKTPPYPFVFTLPSAPTSVIVK
jgi:hypothetical protein